MPSDDTMEMALRALAGPIEAYRSAVVTTAEEVRGYLASHRAKSQVGDEGLAAGLGQFAAGLIDVDRFSSLIADDAAPDLDALEKVESAYEILSGIAAGGVDAFRLELKSGQRLRDAIAQRCADIGRAFAAARVAGMATTGSLNSKNGVLLGPLAFERWNEAERQLAPPLVVELDGAALRASELAEFLDGNVKILLLARGAAPPAPLVRLITPATFVLQTSGEAGLERFAAFQGAAVAAIIPEGCAEFIHDPDAGPELWQRIEIVHMPEAAPGRAIGGVSAWQMTEELHQLKTLGRARGPEVEEGEAVAAPAGEDPVDKLAAWLLSRADLNGIE